MSTGLYFMNLRVYSVIAQVCCIIAMRKPAMEASFYPINAGACSNGMSVSMQSVMLVNIIYFLYLCLVTLPIYSLVVHMGKVLREQALPTEMRERLQRAQVLHEQVPPLLFYIVS